MPYLDTRTIIGHVGRDPEYTPGDKERTKWSVAVSYFMGRDADKHTEWYDVTVWGGQARRAADWLKKGDLVCISGIVTPWIRDDGRVTWQFSEKTVWERMTHRGVEARKDTRKPEQPAAPKTVWERMAHRGVEARKDTRKPEQPAAPKGAAFDNGFAEDEIPF